MSVRSRPRPRVRTARRLSRFLRAFRLAAKRRDARSLAKLKAATTLYLEGRTP